MKYFRLLLLLAVCITATFKLATAQDGISQLSIQQALQLAEQNNPAINQLREELEIKRSLRGMAWGIGNPEIYYFREGMNDRMFSEQRWGVSQALPFPLTGYYRFRSAIFEEDAIRFQLEAENLALRSSVKKAYTRLAYSIKNHSLMERRVELSRELQLVARARLEAGESSELDLIQADIQLAEAENDLRDAETKVDSSRYALFRVIGLDVEEQRYEITFPDTLAFIDFSIDQETVMSVLSDHPEIGQFRESIHATQQKVKAAGSSYLPDLRIQLYKQDFGNDYDFTGFEVGVRVPVWFFLNQSRETQAARARVRQAEWQLSDSALRIKEQAEQAWHGYETSRFKILTFRNQIRERASLLMNLTGEGYRLGELDLLRVLEAQRTYLSSEQRYFEALREYYLKVIELERFLQTELIFNR